MINTSQLQIGSKIAFGTSFPNEPLVWTVTGVSIRAVVAERNGETRVLLPDQINPVVLTTDWLKRAGWFYAHGWYHMGCNFEITETADGWEMETASGDVIHSFTYLHELQLLMAALVRPITFDGK